MILSELFRRLALGELSNLSWADVELGTLAAEREAGVILYANNALERLHTRFVLREEELELPVVEGQRLYPLGDNVLRVLRVTDAMGEPFLLNQEDNKLSLYTPSNNSLRIPFKLKEQTLLVEYQAGPEKLVDGDDEQEILLPDVLEPALSAYIAHEVYGAMNGREHQAVSIMHKNKFEELCLEVETQNILGKSRAGHASRFEQNGWV